MEKTSYLNLPPQSSKENIPVQSGGDLGTHNESEGRPPDSYAQMIAKAIKTSGSYCATLQEIYDFITSTYPYYYENKMHWKNSVRHNLTVQKDLFRRLPVLGNEPEARGCSRWTLVDGFQELLEKRQKRRNPCMRTTGQKTPVRSKLKKMEPIPVENRIPSPPAIIFNPIPHISPPDSPASLTSSLTPSFTHQENYVIVNDPYFAKLTPAPSVSPAGTKNSPAYFHDHYVPTHFESIDKGGSSLLDSLISGEVLPGELSPYKEDFYPSPPEAVPVSIHKNEAAFQVSELTPLSNLDVFRTIGNGISPLSTHDVPQYGIRNNFRYYIDVNQQDERYRSQFSMPVASRTPIDQILVVDTSVPPLCTV